MSGLLPVALYGLEVPPGEVLVPACIDFPATIRITMAAIDPTAPPEADDEGNLPPVPRATLKILKERIDAESDDEEDDDALAKLLAGGDSDEDSDEEDKEANGGPSDPLKSKKSRREAAIKELLAGADSDDDMEDAGAQPNGSKNKKGKEKAKGDDEEDDDEESDEDSDIDMEDYVVCTLDTERNYQQPLDLVVGENEKVFFMVSGTHTIYLTGNYVMPDEKEGDSEYDSDDDDDDEGYDLPPDLDDESDLSDELDDVDGVPRVQEVDTDEEEAPKLVDTKKGKNKRPAEDEAESLDDMVAKDGKKLSKKQQKKLKTESAAKEAAKDSPASGKKVQFAKELEQGPTGPAAKEAAASKPDSKAKPGIKVVQGVTIDDRKIGTGRTVKAGDKVGMRYIGKLENGKVFDANKKGPPFTCKIGKGEVIKGWDIGIVGMAVGGERRLTIPSSLAYGKKAMPDIPANSTLIFDVKLLEIK